MDRDLLADALAEFEAIEEAESKNRTAWVEDMRFAMLSDQWPEAVKRQREQDHRPCLTINRLPAFIRQVTNDARMNKPSIVCHPAGDGATKHTALILNGLIRNIEYSSNADIAYDTAMEHAVGGGFGYLRITTQYANDDAFDQDLVIERVANPLSIYGDRHSTAADSSDWMDAFVTENYTEADFKKKWPGAASMDFKEAEKNERQAQWLKKDAVRVAEWWKREEVPSRIFLVDIGGGRIVLNEDRLKTLKETLPELKIIGDRESKTFKVTQRIINGAEILETNKWAGRYIPIVPVYGAEVIVEDERTLKSLTRDAKDAQRMLNYWRTTSTELVALAPKAPWVGPKGFANSSKKKWETANVANHAYLEFDGNQPPERQPFQGPPAGALQEALNAQDDMKSIMGIFDAGLGARSNETSGKAILARQREGDVSTFNFVDNLNRAIRCMGRIIVDMIPHVYTTERIIRVIHEDGQNEPVPINQPLPPGPMPGIPQHMQEQQEGITRVYDLTAGKYDITCKAGPSFTTKREESAAQMTEFVRAFPQAAPLIGDLLAKNLDWPGADEIAARLKAMLPPQLQGQNPQAAALQQQMQQLDAAAKDAIRQLQEQLQQCQQQLAKATTQAETAKLNNEADRIKADIDIYKAVSDRMKVSQDLITGASQEMMPAINEAQQQVSQAQAIGQAQQPKAPQGPDPQQLQAVLAAVNSLEQMVEQLMQPRAVLRDENGLLTQY
jgi:hypothetical protein